jgi:hypothetical protein
LGGNLFNTGCRVYFKVRRRIVAHFEGFELKKRLTGAIRQPIIGEFDGDVEKKAYFRAQGESGSSDIRYSQVQKSSQEASWPFGEGPVYFSSLAQGPKLVEKRC